MRMSVYNHDVLPCVCQEGAWKRLDDGTRANAGYEKPMSGPTTNFVGNHMMQGAIDLVQSELVRVTCRTGREKPQTTTPNFTQTRTARSRSSRRALWPWFDHDVHHASASICASAVHPGSYQRDPTPSDLCVLCEWERRRYARTLG